MACPGDGPTFQVVRRRCTHHCNGLRRVSVFVSHDEGYANVSITAWMRVLLFARLPPPAAVARQPLPAWLTSLELGSRMGRCADAAQLQRSTAGLVRHRQLRGQVIVDVHISLGVRPRGPSVILPPYAAAALMPPSALHVQ